MIDGLYSHMYRLALKSSWGLGAGGRKAWEWWGYLSDIAMIHSLHLVSN